MRRTKIRQKSDRKKLRDEIGKLHFQVLKLLRGDLCEIHMQKCHNIGRMHILPVGKYPRLEFVDENIVLAGWFCSHFYTHHDSHDKRANYAESRILTLKGFKNYESMKNNLLIIEKTIDQHTMFYLNCLKEHMQERLKTLKEE